MFQKKLESKKELFDIPELPNREFEAMLMQAKIKVCLDMEVKKDNTLLDRITPVFSSLKLSATLSLAIITAVIIGYTFILGGSFSYKEINPSNNTAGSNHNLPVVNVSAKGLI